MRVFVGVLTRADRRIPETSTFPPNASIRRRLVLSDETDGDRAPAKRRHVVGRIAGAAGHDFRRVVLENQYGRFARDARDLTVDELVDDQIAKHRNRRIRKVVDEREQALPIDGRWW